MSCECVGWYYSQLNVMFLNTLWMQLELHVDATACPWSSSWNTTEFNKKHHWSIRLHRLCILQPRRFIQLQVYWGRVIFSLVSKSECQTWVRLILASPPKTSMIHHEFQCRNLEGGVICMSLFETNHFVQVACIKILLARMNHMCCCTKKIVGVIASNLPRIYESHILIK